MSFDTAQLAALVGSRICHDLISPVGAINNGLELLGMSQTHDGPEMHLIGESVENASARIRFFRIAFGAAGHQMVGHNEVQSILRDLYKESRLEVAWLPTEHQHRACVRLAFVGLLCLETAMPFGGRITISQTNGQWEMRGTGDKLNINSDLWSNLAQLPSAEPLQPAHVQFALMPVFAAEENRRVATQSDEKTVILSF